MSKYDALFEDEDDIFAGTPVSKYWEISNQVSDDLMKDEFDKLVERLVVMEILLSQTHDENNFDSIIRNYALTNYEELEQLKKSKYIDLTTQLIYRVPE